MFSGLYRKKQELTPLSTRYKTVYIYWEFVERKRRMKRFLMFLVLATVIASFLWQILLGLCPVP
jgi:hypothetical protein